MQYKLKNVSEVPVDFEVKIPKKFNKSFWLPFAGGNLLPGADLELAAQFSPEKQGLYSTAMYTAVNELRDKEDDYTVMTEAWNCDFFAHGSAGGGRVSLENILTKVDIHPQYFLTNSSYASQHDFKRQNSAYFKKFDAMRNNVQAKNSNFLSNNKLPNKKTYAAQLVASGNAPVLGTNPEAV